MRTPPWAGVPVLIAAMAAVSAVLAARVLGDGNDEVSMPHIPLLVLAAMFAAFELVTLNVQVRKDLTHVQTVTFSEIPLALGLLFASPVELFIAGAVVPILINARKRQSRVKQAFNAANRFAEVAVALAVFRAISPDGPFSLTGWGVLCVALAASGMLTGLAVAAAMSLTSGRVPWEEIPELVLSALPATAIMGTVGFVVATTLHAGDAATWPLVVCMGIALVGLRSFSRLTERHSDLITLHGWGEKIGGASNVNSVLAGVLDAAPEMLSSTRAEVFVGGHDGGPPVRVRRAADGSLQWEPVLLSDVPTARGVSATKRAVVAAAGLGDGREVVVSVSERPDAQRAFGSEDVRLLDMVANQAGLALRNGYMIERLRHDALHDQLTGLPNFQALATELRWRLGDSRGTTVLWLGLHDLEAVNEALGYDLGNELLVQVARRIAVAAPTGSFLSKVGGDEFAVVLPPGGFESPEHVAGLMCSGLGELFVLSGVPVAARASVGIATGGPAQGTSEDLLRHADIAMRACRNAGSGVLEYTPEMDAATADRLQLVADLQDGIPRGELILFAQPKVRLCDGVVVGVEALVRWNHPGRGLVSPGVFVPLAEQTGLDEPMTAWVLHEALTAAAVWAKEGRAITIAVNVPARSLSNHQIVGLVADGLAHHKVAGPAVVIEITESGLLANPTVAAQVLGALARLGVKVSVDDFGTGFSSLSHLKKLPVNEIKVDQSFVFGMLTNPDDAAIVRSVVDLARNLGLNCVAEGIEDESTFEALREMRVDVAQGYWMSKPMPIGEIGAWMDARDGRIVVRDRPDLVAAADAAAADADAGQA